MFHYFCIFLLLKWLIQLEFRNKISFAPIYEYIRIVDWSFTFYAIYKLWSSFVLRWTFFLFSGRSICIPRRELFEALKERGILNANSVISREFLINYITQKYHIAAGSNIFRSTFYKTVKNFSLQLLKKWKKAAVILWGLKNIILSGWKKR